jgi:hypothetical protein
VAVAALAFAPPSWEDVIINGVTSMLRASSLQEGPSHTGRRTDGNGHWRKRFPNDAFTETTGANAGVISQGLYSLLQEHTGPASPQVYATRK